MRYIALSVFVLVGVAPHFLHGQTTNEFLRTNPKFLAAFADVTGKIAPATVRVQADGKDAYLGVLISSDGWVLTKAHELHGKLTCVLHDGQKLDAKIVGVHEPDDLAMLKIPARSLPFVTFSPSKLTKAGAWIASVGPGSAPIAVGVLGGAARKVHEAYLGVLVETTPKGLAVINIAQKSAAFKAGLMPKDILLQIDKQKVADSDALMDTLGDYRPGQTITLKLRRGEKDLELKVTLQSRDQVGDFRSEFQNRLGSDLSTRRGGYGLILQHDSVVKPGDCGGPIVDLKGRVVGINISRAGRVETLAIPSEVIQPLLNELKSGRLTPK